MAKQPVEDGTRLRDALAFFGMREGEVVARTGISQFTLNQIMNGKRSLGREDLRALGKIGISSDYLLGHDKKLVAIGETRPVGELESELAARVTRDALADADQSTRDYWSALIPRVDLLGPLVALVREEIESHAEWAATQLRIRFVIEGLPPGPWSDKAREELQRVGTTPPPGRVFNFQRRAAVTPEVKPTKRRKRGK